MYVYIYIYTIVYVCVCVCVYVLFIIYKSSIKQFKIVLYNFGMSGRSKLFVDGNFRQDKINLAQTTLGT